MLRKHLPLKKQVQMSFDIDFIPADADLVPWVLGVSVVRADGNERVSFPVPAHALAIGSLVLCGELHLMEPDGRRTCMQRWCIAGSATRAQAFEGSPDLVCASLICIASILPLLTGLSARGFVNTVAPPDTLGMMDLGEIRVEDTNQAIANRMMAMLRGRLGPVVVPNSALEFLTTLQQWEGQNAVPSRWSARRWQRACQHQLGVTPKLLQRLVRLHQSARGALGKPGCESTAPNMAWAEHALDAGYSDQSHMSREYRNLAGLTPARASAASSIDRLQPLSIGANKLVQRFLPGAASMSDFSNK
jgi:AraC-like DNA-binding protein